MEAVDQPAPLEQVEIARGGRDRGSGFEDRGRDRSYGDRYRDDRYDDRGGGRDRYGGGADDRYGGGDDRRRGGLGPSPYGPSRKTDYSVEVSGLEPSMSWQDLKDHFRGYRLDVTHADVCSPLRMLFAVHSRRIRATTGVNRYPARLALIDHDPEAYSLFRSHFVCSGLRWLLVCAEGYRGCFVLLAVRFGGLAHLF